MSTNRTPDKTNKKGFAAEARELWGNYRSEFFFGLVLVAIVMTSTYLSKYIPDEVFDNTITPGLIVMTVGVCLGCAWIVLRHSDGLRMRRMWGYALLVWGVSDLIYILGWMIAPKEVMDMSATRLTTHELLLGNLLGWVLTLYPTETLRPGWMRFKVAFWQLLPLAVLTVLDYIMPINLWGLIALYPYLLLALILRQIRKYRQWCEDNYSSMENIDAQWIVRYCIMLFILGANYVYMCATSDHARGFTQQWFALFMLAYSSKQIIFRKDPWAEATVTPGRRRARTKAEQPEETDVPVQPSDREKLEEWMTRNKPYLNPDFQLIDLRAVLPTNRTYLSRFIRDEYGCSFYRFANQYRIEEAKRLMIESPDLKLMDIAEQSGFTSASIFSRTFSGITGVSPSEWLKQTGKKNEQ